MRYYKGTGEGYDEWGDATYLVEVGDDGYATRAVQVYADGQLLLYDREHWHDQYGMLPDGRFDAEPFAPDLTTADEFERYWRPDRATNRTAGQASPSSGPT